MPTQPDQFSANRAPFNGNFCLVQLEIASFEAYKAMLQSCKLQDFRPTWHSLGHKNKRQQCMFVACLHAPFALPSKNGNVKVKTWGTEGAKYKSQLNNKNWKPGCCLGLCSSCLYKYLLSFCFANRWASLFRAQCLVDQERTRGKRKRVWTQRGPQKCTKGEKSAGEEKGNWKNTGLGRGWEARCDQDDTWPYPLAICPGHHWSSL